MPDPWEWILKKLRSLDIPPADTWRCSLRAPRTVLNSKARTELPALARRWRHVAIRHRGSPLCQRSLTVDRFAHGIDDFSAEDYRHLCQLFLKNAAADLDLDKVHRFAPKLNAHQLKLAQQDREHQKEVESYTRTTTSAERQKQMRQREKERTARNSQPRRCAIHKPSLPVESSAASLGSSSAGVENPVGTSLVKGIHE